MKVLRSRLFVLLIFVFLPIIVPVFILFIIVANIVGAKNIRRKHGKIQTPVIYYTNKLTNRNIVFIANCHIGEISYFQKIQNLLDTLSESHFVLYEGIRGIQPEEECQFTEEDKKYFENLGKKINTESAYKIFLSLDHQSDVLSYDSSWINNDISLQDFTKLAPEFLSAFDNKETRQVSNLSRERLLKWYYNNKLGLIVPLSLFSDICAYFSKSKYEQCLVHKRNNVAIQGIKKSLKNGDVVTIWGCAHFWGMDKAFRKLGFTKTKKKWFTFYRVRKYSLCKAFLHLFRNNKKIEQKSQI